MVRRWRATEVKFNEEVDDGNGRKGKIGSGRRPVFLELENVVFDWIIDRRALSLVVSRADIQKFALSMAPEFDLTPDVFKASNHWVDDFLARHELSLRRSTTLFKLEDDEVIRRGLAFKSFVDNTDFARYELSNILAMDQTAVFLGQACQSTVEKKGASSIYVRSTGYESARITCVLAIRLNGEKVPPPDNRERQEREDITFVQCLCHGE